MIRRTLITLLCTICIAGRGADIPSVLILGDDRRETFGVALEKALTSKMVFYPRAGEFRVKYVSVSDVAGAAGYLKQLQAGNYRVLLMCCRKAEADSAYCKKIIKRAAKLQMESLWYGSPGGYVSRNGVVVADYDGFCKGLKKDNDKAHAEYIAEAAAQWWTGMAKTNKGIERIKLWGDKPPHYEYPGPEYINSIARIDHISEPEIECFLPRQQSIAPAVIFFPGGGYSYTGFVRNARELAEILNPQGIAVIGLKYRSKRGADIALEDAQRAMRTVRSRAVEWNIDPEWIGVSGQSAGAHLTLSIATRFTKGDPHADDPVERQSSRPAFAAPLTIWCYGSNESPFVFSVDTPPFFVRQARDDSSFKLAERIVAQLQQANVPVDYLFIENGGHGAFEIAEGNPGRDWPESFVRWLERTMNLKYK